MDVGSMLLMSVFAIPAVAVAGGITAGILKPRGQQRLIELAQRERIAAIERGVDPAKLAPLPVMGADSSVAFQKLLEATQLPPRQAALKQAQGFLLTGVILLFTGLGLSTMLLFLPDPDAQRAWAAGILPVFVGLGLLLAAYLVRRSAPEETRGSDPRV